MKCLSFRAAAAALVCAAVIVSTMVLAQAQPYGGPGMMMGGWGGGLGPFGPILMVLSVAVIVVASIWFLRRFAPVGRHRMGCGHGGGLDVLEQRYARGEINRDEYLQKKGDISAKTN
jgi:putative membrane protein